MVAGLLQWGRNFIVAEMMQDVVTATPELPMLQWGRNFIVAEIGSLANLQLSENVLQWGRNFTVAEIHRGNRSRKARHLASMGPQLYRCRNA